MITEQCAVNELEMATRGETTQKLANQKLPQPLAPSPKQLISDRAIQYERHIVCFCSCLVLSLARHFIIDCSARPRARCFDGRTEHKMIIIKWTR
jgi:hypothetical protein